MISSDYSILPGGQVNKEEKLIITVTRSKLPSRTNRIGY